MELASAMRPVGARAILIARLSPACLVLLVILLGLGVRLIGLGARPLWLDEAYSAWFASRGWHQLWTVVPTYETHPPLYYSLLKLWSSAFGDGARGLRGLSILLGLATVPVVAAIAREQEQQQRPTGNALIRIGFAAFLCGFSPMLVFLDQEARPYPLMALAYAVAILGLVRLLREFREGGPGTIVSWAILASGTELTLWSHALGLLYALCIAAALAPSWFAHALDRTRLRRGATAALLVALFYVPCLLMMARRASDWGSGWLRLDRNIPFELLQLYTVPMEVLTVGSLFAAVGMLLLAKRAIEGAVRARGWDTDRAMMLLWLGPPLLSVLISLFWMPIFLTRTLGATVIPAALAMADALTCGKPRERWLIALAIVLPLLPTAIQVATRPAPEPWDDVAVYVRDHARPTDQIWYYPNDSMLPLRATGALPAPDRGIPGNYPGIGFNGPVRGGSPAVVSLTRTQAAEVVSNPALRAVPTIWLVTRGSATFDPAGDLPRALGHLRHPGTKQQWGEIGVQPFSTAPTGR